MASKLNTTETGDSTSGAGTTGKGSGTVSDTVPVPVATLNVRGAVTPGKDKGTTSDVFPVSVETLNVVGAGKLRLKDISKKYLNEYDRYVGCSKS